MADVKISAGADPGTLTATDKVPLARSASTTAYAATIAELATYANGAYTPNYSVGTPSMDGTGAAGTAAFVSHGDHVHPSDTSRAPLASPTFTGTPASTTPTTGDSTTRIATTAFVQAQMVASGAGVSTWNTRAGAVVLQQADIVAVGALHDIGRNLIHNPLFNVAQRGAGPWTTIVYTADRWKMVVAGSTLTTSIVTLSDADRTTIGDETARFSFQGVCGGTAGAGDVAFFYQAIEDVRRLSGKTVTVSFWAKALAGTPKVGVNLTQNFGTGGSPSGDLANTAQAVTLSTNWARYTLTFVLPSVNGKTFGTSNTDQTQIFFWQSTGATSNVAAGSIGVQSYTLQLWGVQLEVGSQATPLEKPDLRYDLANCQRFYQVANYNFAGYGAAGNNCTQTTLLLTQMRAAPTIVNNVTSSTNVTLGSSSVAGGATSLIINALTTALGVFWYIGNFAASADL